MGYQVPAADPSVIGDYCRRCSGAFKEERDAFMDRIKKGAYNRPKKYNENEDYLYGGNRVRSYIPGCVRTTTTSGCISCNISTCSRLLSTKKSRIHSSRRNQGRSEHDVKYV